MYLVVLYQSCQVSMHKHYARDICIFILCIYICMHIYMCIWMASYVCIITVIVMGFMGFNHCFILFCIGGWVIVFRMFIYIDSGKAGHHCRWYYQMCLVPNAKQIMTIKFHPLACKYTLIGITNRSHVLQVRWNTSYITASNYKIVLFVIGHKIMRTTTYNMHVPSYITFLPNAVNAVPYASVGTEPVYLHSTWHSLFL